MSAIPTLIDGRLVDRNILAKGRVARVLEALDGADEETRIVGGAVRDLVLGFKASDFDLTTTALPDTVIKRARAAGFKAVPTGIEHGTVTVIVEGAPFETTTLREDIETDGRRAKVRFGRDFAKDALRRDFTINALSLSRDGVVHDYTGGLGDLAAHRVRFIGEARQRIREDFLRSLRFFRFSATYGAGALDAEGFLATVQERDGLSGLSRERVAAELFKLLKAPRAAEVVTALCETGLLGPLIAAAPDPTRHARLVAIERAHKAPPDALLRLAALVLRIEEDAERLRERLRLSNAEYERLSGAAQVLERLHGLSAPPSHGELRALLFAHGRQAAMDAFALAHVDSGAAPDDARFVSAARFLADTPQPTLPFSGADILARGVASGHQVGLVLKGLQARWIRAGFPKDPTALAALLDEAVAEARGEGR
ncbi:MAG TPA: CCA tRNA nucleotidyltransferase [Roseiarcus sp.]|nr:CCA tRNA nucleotidyltransferase [Roseiarcus sp.]